MIPGLPEGQLILPDTICSIFEQNTDDQRFGGRMRTERAAYDALFWQIFVEQPDNPHR
jgi:hypothetical protein